MSTDLGASGVVEGGRLVPPSAPERTRVALHYFSGTGNTYRVASWIAREAMAQGAEVEMVAISAHAAAPSLSAAGSGRRLLGVLTPTHGFTAPWGALKYVAKLPGVRGADVFTVVTRAGSFPGFRMPGFEGTAAWLLALMLALRGGHLVGVRAVDMPSNWTSLHWGMSEEHVAAIVKAGEVRTSAFADRVLQGRSMLTGWVSLAFGLLIAPVSLLYLILARPLLGKLFFTDERCTSCGLCAKHCPFDAVRMTGRSPSKPYWTVDCESCMRCMNICPEHAVQASWVAAVAQTYLMLVVFELIAGSAAVLGGFAAESIALIAACAAVLVLTVPAYWLAWLLGRRYPIAWVRGHLTPTRIYRRYREPGTDLREI